MKDKKKNSKQTNKTTSNTLNIIISVLLKIMFVLLVIICLFIIYYIVSVKIYRNTGYKHKPYLSMHAISTESMKDELNVDDVVFDIIPSQKDIKVGDIITYIPSSYKDHTITVTHRVVEIIEIDGTIYYKTKGDNNNFIDEELISYDNILGKVLFKIPYIGKMQYLL